MTDQPMSAVDLNSAITVARRVEALLGSRATATRFTITAAGLDVEVSCAEAAARIVEPHPLKERRTAVLQFWSGMIGETPVTVHVVTATPSPAPHQRVHA